MLINPTQEITENLLPIDELAEYLQLQTSTSGNVRQDSVLLAALRTSIDWVQNQTNIFILRQVYETRAPSTKVVHISYGDQEKFEILNIKYIDRSKTELEIDDYDLDIQKSDTKIRFGSEISGGELVITFYLGAEVWKDVKPDLRFAIIILAAHFYEQRHETSGQNISIPRLVFNLTEKYKKYKISGRSI